MALPRFFQTLCVVLLAGFAAATTGCNGAPPIQDRANYTDSLNKYYEGRPLCLWQRNVKFPLEAAPEQVDQLGLNALVDSGLLVRRRAGRGFARASLIYELTPEGQSAFEEDIFDHGSGNFCYGRRRVVSVDAARQNTRSSERVDYHYTIERAAAWANEYPIRKKFPSIASELNGKHTAEATLLDTTDGWQVAGTPMPVQEQRPSTLLTKAKVLLGLKKNESS